MPRNGSGSYSLPTGNPVVSGTVIESTWANNTLNDIATELTNSLSRTGAGGMTAAFRAADGSSSVPGISWSNETTSGFYRAGSNDFRFVIATSLLQKWTASGTEITGTLSVSGNATLSSNTTLSSLTASKVVFSDASKVLTSTGTVGVDQGGTGQTSYTNGQLLIGNTTGNTLAKATLTAGTGISITNGAGAITIASTVVGDVTLAGNNVFTGSNTFKGVTDTVFTISDAAAFEIDPANGSIQVVTLGANRTPAATNFAAGQSVLLGIDDGTAYTITWTTVNPIWVQPNGGGSAPTLATSGYTWVLLWKAGSTIYGAVVGSP